MYAFSRMNNLLCPFKKSAAKNIVTMSRSKDFASQETTVVRSTCRGSAHFNYRTKY